MKHYQIKNRWTDAVLFEGDFDTMRLCAEAARRSGANLYGANLSGANLSGANLYGANLYGADLSRADLSLANIYGVKITALRKTCSRSDGYDFWLFQCEDRAWRVMAGCRWFSIEDAWKHWTRTRDGTPLGEETFDILVMFEHHIERVEART
jgi:hypothetical protein